MSQISFIFPGQGSQFVGMGRELAAAFPQAREVFEEVNEALGEDLSALMWSGDADTLTLTSNAQPALMAHSLAATRSLEGQFGITVETAAFVAGHSLGEYSALAAAGAFDIADAARLLRIRGNAMQSAVPAGEGAMAALLGAELNQAEAACKAGRAEGVCEIANDNAPGQLVISGATAAVEMACAAAKDLGVKKAVPLAVSAPFHCSLMEPAAEAMAAGLAATPPKTPRVPVVANVSAAPTQDPDLITRQLVAQVKGRVRWTETVQFLVSQGIRETVEIGPGKVLTVMQRRIDKGLIGHCLNTPHDLEAFAAHIKG
ncbi:MAG: ACP S-malonyltransferase [Pseudomonadota bacterium]